jgi:hypothetical protein
MTDTDRSASRRLRLLLAATGTVATLAGGSGVLRGLAGVSGRGADGTDASTDSELRFFAAWYAVGGAAMLRAARQPEPDPATVRLVAGGWLLAAAGRVLSLRAAGRPHPLYLGLTAAEVAIPTALWRWRTTRPRRAG